MNDEFFDIVSTETPEGLQKCEHCGELLIPHEQENHYPTKRLITCKDCFELTLPSFDQLHRYWRAVAHWARLRKENG